MANYIQGDTVKLSATFYDWTGGLHNLTGVTLKIYNASGVQVWETIDGADIVNGSTGYYYHLYTLPLTYSSLIYEFSGTDDDGKVQLHRTKLGPIFAD
jgi:hypothetical protein